ncbi:MAG TPA: homoserine dehydrogenase [Blastocatellia bacterium]|nr:homoserine dehydrogenase [Blastocatellia bacterium]
MKIAIIGFGNVGRAFAELIEQRRDWLRANYNEQMRVVGLSDRSGVIINADGLAVPALMQLKQSGRTLESAGAQAASPAEAVRLFAEAGAQVLIETLPSGLKTEGEPAITFATEALSRGLHVVTANKAVLLFAGSKLEQLAADKGVRIAHSGATCAALPTLSFARRELVGVQITAIRGILNGTTNYILTRMNEDGLSFDAALAEAQARGIAEPDPRYDTEGHDSAAKLVILANALMNAEATLDDVSRTGIDALPQALLEEAQATKGAIKLIASARLNAGRVELSVRPQLVPPTDSLFAVRGSNKAVEFETDLYGTLLVAGGASSRTAVAATLLKDVISCLA